MMDIQVEAIVLVVHVLLALLLLALILIQHGKGADAGAAFGAGASGTVFGSSGSASFLTKLTTWVAISFFATSLGLAYLSAHSGTESTSVFDSVVEEQVGDVPAEPEALAVDEPAIEEEPASDIPATE